MDNVKLTNNQLAVLKKVAERLEKGSQRAQEASARTLNKVLPNPDNVSDEGLATIKIAVNQVLRTGQNQDIPLQNKAMKVLEELGLS